MECQILAQVQRAPWKGAAVLYKGLHNNHIAMQIGNAVPVRLAQRLGEHILNTARNSESNHQA